jgi:3-dehydroshikimate dehydratase
VMLPLAAFADEISPKLDDQIRVCRENGVSHFELRGVYGKNVLDFDAAVRAEIKQKLTDNGMGVISIGSPIGKVKVTDPWPVHFDRFKIAVDAAEYFGAPLIRLFSYYPPEHGQDMSRHRDEVMRRMQAKVDYVKDRPVTLVHENEKDIYGDVGSRCVDLMRTVSSPKLRCAFDFANFIQCNEKPLEIWPQLKEYTVHIHIKDASARDGKVVPAGHGDGHIGAILKDAYTSGYRGFLSLEPHLAAAGQYSGFSGPALFKTAVDALRQVCKEIRIPLAPPA